MEHMTTLDLGITAIVILLGLKGFFNGLFKELFGLIGIIGGVYVGTRLGHDAGLYINDNFLHLQNSSVIVVTGFLATLILFWFGSTLLGNFFSMLSEKSGLGAFDRILGFSFAGAKITMIISVIFFAIFSIKVTGDSLRKNTADSILTPYLLQIGAKIVNADFSAIVSSNSNNQTEKNHQTEISKEIENIKNSILTVEQINEKVNNTIGEIVEEQLAK